MAKRFNYEACKEYETGYVNLLKKYTALESKCNRGCGEIEKKLSALESDYSKLKRAREELEIHNRQLKDELHATSRAAKERVRQVVAEQPRPRGPKRSPTPRKRAIQFRENPNIHPIERRPEELRKRITRRVSGRSHTVRRKE